MEDPRSDDTLRLLGDSIRRFVEKEVVPKAQKWEQQGFVPREVLREMGRLGFLGLRYAEEFGGGGLDARATALLAEELGRSTFGGFATCAAVRSRASEPTSRRWSGSRRLRDLRVTSCHKHRSRPSSTTSSRCASR